MRRALFLLALAGCSEPTPPATDPTEPPTSERPPDPADLESARRREAEASCSAACGHIATCAGPEAASDCEPDCRTNLIGDAGIGAHRYASCVQSLDCPTVAKSVAMSMGPLGLCRVEAARAER